MSTTLLRLPTQRCARSLLRRPPTAAPMTSMRCTHRGFVSSTTVDAAKKPKKQHETKTEPGKKVAPHDGVPFAAPPRDETKGQLGQVFLPNMAQIEYVAPAPIQIPGEPDNYSLLSTDQTLDSYPHLHDPTPKVFTVTSKETHLGGGPESAASREDPVV
ncbi:BQ2448_7453 [Microbotryum intermedium]|uniref:BQ2448_7453 protein n=1 Tax=Microbotryum intermedium TaxID=269621 RepID=A0A238FJW2_9BASI|nr:BQ2448_7453 [Microbotryum intermedium]